MVSFQAFNKSCTKRKIEFAYKLQPKKNCIAPQNEPTSISKKVIYVLMLLIKSTKIDVQPSKLI